MPTKKRRARSAAKNSRPSPKRREKASVTYDVRGAQPPPARVGPKGCEWMCHCPKCDDPVALLVEFKFRDGSWKWLYFCDECGGGRDYLKAITPEGEDWRKLMDAPQSWLPDANELLRDWFKSEQRRLGLS